MRDLQTIETDLQAKRCKMIETGMALGLSHPESVRLSQEVDQLHNEYMAERAAQNKREAQRA